MDKSRRELLKAGGGMTLLGMLAAAGFLRPGEAAAAAEWNQAAFETKGLAETIKALGGSGSTESKEITITAPEIAENGAVVPLAVVSKIPKTESIAILVEKNPNTLIASFDIPEGTEPSIGTRVKMAETSNVFALIKADGKFYTVVKEIKVTLGGCGG